MNELQTAIGQIATFMICAQAIAHFRPRESYGKYLRMLLSVMILVQVFQPFCQLLWGISGEELYQGVEEFQKELDKSMATAAEQSVLTGEQLEQMSLSEVQERLEKQALQMEEAGGVQIDRIERVTVEIGDK